METKNQNQQPDNHIDYFAPKILWTIIAVLLLVVIVGSVAWWKEIKKASPDNPTTCAERKLAEGEKCMEGVLYVNDTRDWKTYTNTEYGFEFKYPTNSVIDETIDNGYIVVNARNFPEDDSPPLKEGQFYSQIYIAQREHEKMPCSEFLVNLKKASVAGTSVVGYTGSLKEGAIGSGAGLCIEIPQKYTFISVVAADQQLSDQILSTFRFIDMADVSAWKTYTNTEYGYSIQYPKGLDQHPEFASNPKAVGINLDENANLLITVDSVKTPLRDEVNRPEYYGYSKVAINGMIGYQRKSHGTMGYLFVETLIYAREHVYILEFSDEPDTKKLELLDQILSTFKFTK
jgi:hypothetical protein